MNCPCSKPDSGSSVYDCELLDCRMTPRYCGMYQARPDYRKAWDEGRGPGQVVKTRPAPPKTKDKGGPGAELKRLLKRLFILSTGGCGCCGCNSMAAKMDRWGPAGCREPEHWEEILRQMKAEAAKRKLPFSRIGSSVIIRCAIRRAERRALE